MIRTWSDDHWEHCRSTITDCQICQEMFVNLSKRKKQRVIKKNPNHAEELTKLLDGYGLHKPVQWNNDGSVIAR